MRVDDSCFESQAIKLTWWNDSCNRWIWRNNTIQRTWYFIMKPEEKVDHIKAVIFSVYLIFASHNRVNVTMWFSCSKQIINLVLAQNLHANSNDCSIEGIQLFPLFHHPFRVISQRLDDCHYCISFKQNTNRTWIN